MNAVADLSDPAAAILVTAFLLACCGIAYLRTKQKGTK